MENINLNEDFINLKLKNKKYETLLESVRDGLVVLKQNLGVTFTEINDISENEYSVHLDDVQMLIHIIEQNISTLPQYIII